MFFVEVTYLRKFKLPYMAVRYLGEAVTGKYKAVS